MNTPDTEWASVEEMIENLAGGFETWDSFYSGLTITQEVEQDTTKLYEQYLIEYIKDALSSLLTSRDTYWKERVRKWANENSKELSDPYPFDSKYTYSDFVSVSDLEAFLTNKDNLK